MAGARDAGAQPVGALAFPKVYTQTPQPQQCVLVSDPLRPHSPERKYLPGRSARIGTWESPHRESASPALGARAADEPKFGSALAPTLDALLSLVQKGAGEGSSTSDGARK